MKVFYSCIVFAITVAAFNFQPQPLEINDQLQLTNTVNISHIKVAEPNLEELNRNALKDNKITIKSTITNPDTSLTIKIYRLVADPIIKIIQTPKVNQVLRNVGICLLNGAMEIISYYVPAPMLPLVVSAAGLMIPFEPVVMLKERMPVTSYRRAFHTAMKTFLGMFDKYKHEDDFDPYMTRRFNRRLNNNVDENDKERNVI